MEQCNTAQSYLADTMHANTNLAAIIAAVEEDPDAELAKNSGDPTDSKELAEFITAVAGITSVRLAELDSLIKEHISEPVILEKWAQTFNLLGPLGEELARLKIVNEALSQAVTEMRALAELPDEDSARSTS